MKPTDYQKQILKIQEAAEKKEKRLLKRLELAKGKPKPIPMSKLKKELKRITHAIVRLTYDNCYSCDKFVPLKERQAGHYHTDGGNPGTRYDFRNIRTQHAQCNYYSGGDAHFGARLLQEIGAEGVAELDLIRKRKLDWTKDDYMKLIVERKVMLYLLEGKTNSP